MKKKNNIKKTKENDRKKIIIGSEPPTIPTGYGVVVGELSKRWADLGWDSYIIGWQHISKNQLFYDSKKENGGKVRILQNISPNAICEPLVLEGYAQKIKPDIVFSLVDIWFIKKWVEVTNKLKIPYVAYFPVDGYPWNVQWEKIINKVSYPMCMSKFGSNVVNDWMNNHASLQKSSDEDFFDKDDDDVENFFNKKNYDIPFIHHGVNKELYKPIKDELIQKNREENNTEDKFVYEFVGKNNERKQIDRLIRAFKIVREEYSDVQLIMKVGDPVSDLGRNLFDIVSKENLSKEDVTIADRPIITSEGAHYNYLNSFSENELNVLYNYADVQVSCTSGEGFGLSTIESMATGTPVILPDYSANTELLGGKRPSPYKLGNKLEYNVEEQKDNPASRGWLIPNRDLFVGQFNVYRSMVDIKKTADKMIEAYNSPKKLRKKEKKSLDWASKKTWERIAYEFVKYFYKILEENE